MNIFFFQVVPLVFSSYKSYEFFPQVVPLVLSSYKSYVFSFFRLCRSFCQVIKVGEFCTDGTVMELPGGNGINQLWQANGRLVGNLEALCFK